MTKIKVLGNVGLSLILIAALVSGSLAVASQEKTDEELKKKYGAILGEYEFDLSELGGDTQILTFYIQEGELWADSGDGRPAILEPVESDEGMKFTAEDPESGVFEITFLKDEEGNYTKCRAYIHNMDLEIEGIKISG